VFAFAIKDTVPLLMFMGILLFLCALIGTQLFGGQFCGMDRTSSTRVVTSLCADVPRNNFDNIGYSLVTVFVIFCGDGWRTIMANGRAAVGDYSAIYFCMCYLLGGYLMINLFVAVMISSGTTAEAEPEQQLVRTDRLSVFHTSAPPPTQEQLHFASSDAVELSSVPDGSDRRSDDEDILLGSPSAPLLSNEKKEVAVSVPDEERPVPSPEQRKRTRSVHFSFDHEDLSPSATLIHPSSSSSMPSEYGDDDPLTLSVGLLDLSTLNDEDPMGAQAERRELQAAEEFLGIDGEYTP
jgi:hypothetical protein